MIANWINAHCTRCYHSWVIGKWRALKNGEILELSRRHRIENRSGRILKMAVLDSGVVEIWEVGE